MQNKNWNVRYAMNLCARYTAALGYSSKAQAFTVRISR